MTERNFISRRKDQLKKEGIKRVPDNTPLTSIEFSVRAADFLEANGFRTIGDVCAKTEPELKKLITEKKASRLVLRDIKNGLEAVGRKLKEGP